MIPFDFSNLIIRQVELAITVTWQKGNSLKMTTRKSFGITFAKSGVLTYIMDGEETVSDQQRAVLLPKGGTYSIICQEAGCFPVINFQCEQAAFHKILALPAEDNATYISDFAKLEKLLEINHRENQLRSLAVLYEIFARLHDTSTYANASFHILDPAIEYLQTNLTNPNLNAAVLAKKANVSSAYFRRLFKERYGAAPKQYIQSMRLQRAKRLLETGLLSVTDIAKKTGYADIYHFSRAFSHFVGCSPTRYAARNLLPRDDD